MCVCVGGGYCCSSMAQGLPPSEVVLGNVLAGSRKDFCARGGCQKTQRGVTGAGARGINCQAQCEVVLALIPALWESTIELQQMQMSCGTPLFLASCAVQPQELSAVLSTLHTVTCVCMLVVPYR